MLHPFFDVERPVVIGHRGAAGERPENTLLSFETALAQGARILESDIHVSRDGVPILLHDPTLERTTNATDASNSSDATDATDATGDARNWTWAELQLLDAGYRFEDAQGRTPYRDKGIRIASLEAAFTRFPEARFNLEIKCEGEAGIRATLDLVERFDRADRTLLAAGENVIMRELRSALRTRSIAPALGASLEEIVAAVSSAVSGSPMPPGVMALQIPASFAGNPLATPEFVAHAHAHDVQVHVWTINDLAEIEALLKNGVDGIVTDHPGQMAEWLRRGRRA